MKKSEKIYIPTINGAIVEYVGNCEMKTIGEYAYDIEAGYIAYRYGNGKARRFDGTLEDFVSTLPWNVDCFGDVRTVCI